MAIHSTKFAMLALIWTLILVTKLFLNTIQYNYAQLWFRNHFILHQASTHQRMVSYWISTTCKTVSITRILFINRDSSQASQRFTSQSTYCLQQLLKVFTPVNNWFRYSMSSVINHNVPQRHNEITSTASHHFCCMSLCFI